MVIARDAEPALGWRFALSTSSISAFPGALEDAPRWARIARESRDQAPMIESRNVGRTTRDFQCRERIINRLFELALFWRQQSAGPAAGTAQQNASVPNYRNGGAGSFSRKS
jgi:hypothetical protein